MTVETERDRLRAELINLLAKRAEINAAIEKLYAMLDGFELCNRALDAEANSPLAQDEGREATH